MKIFSDALDRQWTITINVWTAKKLKAAMGLDLLAPETCLAEMIDDTLTFCNALWHMLADEAARRGVSEESFFTALTAPVIDQARTSFCEEWQDFFRQSQDAKAQALVKIIDKARELRTTSAMAAAQKIEQEASNYRQTMSGTLSTATPE